MCTHTLTHAPAGRALCNTHAARTQLCAHTHVTLPSYLISLSLQIVSSGYSRVPVFAGSRQNVLGALIIKMLIVLNYQDRVPIRELQLRPLPIVAASTPLYHILNQFQLGKSHMALVRKDDSTELLGIITMEDVFEEVRVRVCVCAYVCNNSVRAC